MKGLSIEEKAEAYDKAIQRAKEILEIGVKDSRDKKVILSFFPELKEQEDERTRKEILNFITYVADSKCNKKEWIAWLEKQGNQPNKVSIWKHWKDGIAGNGNGEPIYLIKDCYRYSLSSCLSFECDYIELSELDKLMLESEVTKNSDKEWSDDDKKKLNRIYQLIGEAACEHAFSTTCRLIGDKEAVELQDFLRSIAKK